MARRTALAVLAVPLLVVGAAAAQETVEPERCPKLVASGNPLPFVPVSFTRVQTEGDEMATNLVDLTYIGHSTFVIRSPSGITIATDYNGVDVPPVVPRIVTMNRAHSTHFTLNPDPRIEYVLHGWGEGGEPARHELAIGDVLLRNVTTNIRGDIFAETIDQNSMFVFEVAGLCIAHLGHLHHKLTSNHLKALGRIDVVLAPVDGTYTLGVDDMIDVLDELQSPLVIPMHFFGPFSLDRFLARLEEHFAIVWSDSPTVELSRATLPVRRTVLVLPPF